MAFDLCDFLSFMIRSNGEIVPMMPDDEEFSAQQIRDYVAGPPEVVGETPDGFILFQNKDGKNLGLPLNEIATHMGGESAAQAGGIVGRVFVAHPDHIAPFWRRMQR